MKEKFPEFYIDFDKLWKKAVFVFDTNVLLDILRMPKTERDSFIKIINELKKTNSIWLPFQVGLEYHNHYKEIIKENDLKIDEARTNIKNSLNKIMVNCYRNLLFNFEFSTLFFQKLKIIASLA